MILVAITAAIVAVVCFIIAELLVIELFATLAKICIVVMVIAIAIAILKFIFSCCGD